MVRIWTKYSLVAGSIWILIVLVPHYYNQYYHGEQYQRSKILQSAVQYGKFVHTVDLKAQKSFRDDPFTELSKKEIVPAFRKMQSIKNQLRIYENMQRIPGGPQNFIQTTYKALGEVKYQIFVMESKYHAICDKLKEESRHLKIGVKQVHTDLYNVFTQNELNVLSQIGIVADLKGKQFQDKPKKTFGQILEHIEYVSKLYTKLENKKVEIDDLSDKMNVKKGNEGLKSPDLAKLYTDLHAIQFDIKTNVLRGTKHVKFYVRYLEIYLHRIMENYERGQKFLVEKKDRYKKLLQMLNRDVPKVRLRLKNLEYGKITQPNEL